MKRALLLVDHGSRRAEANAQLDDLADAVRTRRPECFVAVAHLDLVQPDVSAGIEACAAQGAEEIVVHPFFLAPGRHSTRDIPEQVESAATRHPGIRIAISDPIGLHTGLVDAVLARIDEAG